MTQIATPEKRPELPLRAVREAQGLSLRRAAREARISAAHLSRVERGEGSLSINALARLARVLGLRDLAKHLSLYQRETS